MDFLSLRFFNRSIDLLSIQIACRDLAASHWYRFDYDNANSFLFFFVPVLCLVDDFLLGCSITDSVICTNGNTGSVKSPFRTHRAGIVFLLRNGWQYLQI